MKTLLEWLEENRSTLKDGVYYISHLNNIFCNQRAVLLNADDVKRCDNVYQVKDGGITLVNKPVSDPVNSPSHYASGDIECIDAIKASMTREAFLGYLKGNIQKYMWRYEKKVNPIEDVKKARWYMNKLVDELDK